MCNLFLLETTRFRFSSIPILALTGAKISNIFESPKKNERKMQNFGKSVGWKPDFS